MRRSVDKPSVEKRKLAPIPCRQLGLANVEECHGHLTQLPCHLPRRNFESNPGQGRRVRA